MRNFEDACASFARRNCKEKTRPLLSSAASSIRWLHGELLGATKKKKRKESSS
jgi:hypothetical protein